MNPSVSIRVSDALLVVDMQNDFLPGGALAVPGGEQVIPVVNRCLGLFAARSRPIFMTRDWHSSDHGSFAAQGGIWPAHCVAGSRGAEFSAGLVLPSAVEIVSKGRRRETPGYSGFEATDLRERLDRAGVRRLFVAGLATDYCVLHTVLEALKIGFEVCLLEDGLRAVDLNPGDGGRALDAMRKRGAQLIRSDLLQ